MALERVPGRRGKLSQVGRSDRLAAGLSLAMTLVLAVALWLALDLVERHDRDPLVESTQRVLASVGSNVATTVERAVDYGIPLAELYGLQEYLAEVLQANPEVSAIAVEAAQGGSLASAGRPLAGAASVAVPILRADEHLGQVSVTAANRLLAQAHLARRYATAAGLVLLALVSCLMFRVYLLESIDLPQARLVAGLRAVRRGHFGELSPLSRWSPLRQVGESARLMLGRTWRAHRTLAALAHEIRAVDFDGSVRPKVDAALARAEQGRRFVEGREGRVPRLWHGWLVLPVVLLGQAVLPLVGGFAADRAETGSLETLVVSGTFGAEALGAILGVLLASSLRPPLRLCGVGLLVGGAATIATYWLRDAGPFMASRFAAAFGVWFCLFGLLMLPGRAPRRPWLAFVLLIGGACCAPMLGSLAAEGLGRRLGYAAVGAALLLLGLAILALRRRQRSVALASARPTLRVLIGLGVAGFAVTAWLHVGLATFPLRYAYAEVALLFAAQTLGVTLSWILPRTLPLPYGLLCQALGPLLALAIPGELSLFGGAALLGLGLGAVWRRSRSGGASRAGAISIALGIVLGAAAGAFSVERGLPVEAVAGCVSAAAGLLLLMPFTYPRSAGRRGTAGGVR